jgi:hypothetical protein
MSERRRRGSLVGPLILIGLGVVFLLNNLGILSWSVWEVILRLWPILLVAIGLDLLVGRRSTLGSLLALALTLIILAGALWFFGAGVGAGSAGPGQQISQPLEGATQAQIVLNPATGKVQVRALSDSANLVEGTLRPAGRPPIQPQFSLQGNSATYVLSRPGASFGPFPSSSLGPTWDLGLNPKVPIDLKVDVGAGEASLDLTQLTLSQLQVNMGVGQTTLTLPTQGQFQVVVDGAIGQTTIVIPQGMAARITVDTGLASSQLPSGYQKQDNVYTSPNFEAADNRVEIKADQAIGNLVVRQPE